AGILNRNGILDALERGQRWLSRRGDIYGVLVVTFPSLVAEAVHGSESTEFRTHVAATIAAAVRDVDSVGRVDERTFAAVLADLNPGAIEIVAVRLRELLDRMAASTPAMGGTFKIGGLEILEAKPSGEVLDTALELARTSTGTTSLGQIT
ncbi:MAG TPA: hypothetical protein VLB67_09190, partial [Acidimicrobiia bacterium]|nr:hypothetical protein [Acidimicrobiia bacterium]